MTSARSALGVTGFMNAAFGFRALFFFPVFAVFFFAVLAIYSPLEDASRRQGVVSRKFVHDGEERCTIALGGGLWGPRDPEGSRRDPRGPARPRAPRQRYSRR